eukprot:jgi/Tetstr1/422148/TSEL_013003.t1
MWARTPKDEEEVCEVTPDSEAAAFPGDNVNEGISPEPPAKKAKQRAKPAVGVPARGQGGVGAMAGGAPPLFGSRACHQIVMPVAAAATREEKARRRGGLGLNRM